MPLTIPTDTALMSCRSGDWRTMRRSSSHRHVSKSAIAAPLIAAVRVPPSAERTSQSTQMVSSGRIVKSIIERRLRPMMRWIS